MSSEFDLISRFFTRPTPSTSLGIGDDCALLTPRAGMQLVISTDMLVSGVHFFPDADPKQLGHKALAVNLSDLAAMGATPIAFTMAISLPAPDGEWLKPFSEGVFALAEKYHCELIGGDTTRGPLNICITIFGEIPPHEAMQRDHAVVNDDIWVSGALGDARAALEFLKGNASIDSVALNPALARLQMPEPRIELGQAIRSLAHAAIDLSDGLKGDLSHILNRSSVGATLNIDDLPMGNALKNQPAPFQRMCMLEGGDDYELCFTAPAANRNLIITAARKAGVPATMIGKIEAEKGLRLVDAKGQPQTFQGSSFDHFSAL